MVDITRSVKGLGFDLSYLCTNKLACCHFVDAVGRHETLGSETKDFKICTQRGIWVTQLLRWPTPDFGSGHESGSALSGESA